MIARLSMASRRRLPGLLLCFGTAVASGAHADHITDELDRQWNQLITKIADEPVGCQKMNEAGWNGIINRPLQQYFRDTKDEIYDHQALILETDRDPLDVVLRRTEALCSYLNAKVDISALRQQLQALASEASGVDPSNATRRRELYNEVCAVRRTIAFSNPLLDFDKILVGGGMTEGFHLSTIAWASQGEYGNWIKVVDNPFSDNPTARDILAGSVFENGPNEGQRIMDLGGAFTYPCLSCDGETVYFAWAEKDGPSHDCRSMFEGAPHDMSWGKGISQEHVYHIYKVNVDGSGLTQLTTGVYNDAHPWELPNGRIAFVSTRRPGNDRCVANKSNTLFSMKSDGSDIIQLSWHETHEWYPCVDNNGMLIYTRWDYVDKGADEGHHLWTCYPDGRDPRAPHGNYPHPRIDRDLQEAYTYFDYSEPDYRGYQDGRHVRPYIEYIFRPIPHSQKLVCVAGRHHGNAVGPLMIVDPTVEDDGLMSQAKRITPYLYPEGEGTCPENYPEEIRPNFSAAWPLSEDFYLTSWGNTLLLLDRFGNQEPLYTDSRRPNFPTPLRARPKPPALASRTHQGESADPNHPRATLSVQDIYITHPFWFPPEVVEQKKVKWLRIVQLFPRMNHTDPEDPSKFGQRAVPVSFTSQQNCRMALGVVPVEEDGSVYCEAPVGKAIYFQALDENHMALHSMRSVTYVHPGEQLSCVGCHESKWKTPPPMNETPLAMQRPPSKLVPEVGDGPEPMNYHRLVKPVFDNTCIPCHEEKNTAGIKTSSYKEYLWSSFHYPTGLGAQAGHGSMTAPGFCGASYTDIGRALVKSHKDRLTDDEWNSVVMWLDLNSMEFGSDFDFDKQRAGELVWPVIDVDPANPTGVERDQPTPGAVSLNGGSAPQRHSRAPRGNPAVTLSGNRITLTGTRRDAGAVGVQIIDVLGRTVRYKTVSGKDLVRGVSIAGINAGIYTVEIVTTHGSMCRQVVITH